MLATQGQPAKHPPVQWFLVLNSLYPTIALCLLDTGFDTGTIAQYALSFNWTWFSFSLGCVLISVVFTTIATFRAARWVHNNMRPDAVNEARKLRAFAIAIIAVALACIGLTPFANMLLYLLASSYGVPYKYLMASLYTELCLEATPQLLGQLIFVIRAPSLRLAAIPASAVVSALVGVSMTIGPMLLLLWFAVQKLAPGLRIGPAKLLGCFATIFRVVFFAFFVWANASDFAITIALIIEAVVGLGVFILLLCACCGGAAAIPQYTVANVLLVLVTVTVDPVLGVFIITATHRSSWKGWLLWFGLVLCRLGWAVGMAMVATWQLGKLSPAELPEFAGIAVDPSWLSLSTSGILGSFLWSVAGAYLFANAVAAFSVLCFGQPEKTVVGSPEALELLDEESDDKAQPQRRSASPSSTPSPSPSPSPSLHRSRSRSHSQLHRLADEKPMHEVVSGGTDSDGASQPLLIHGNNNYATVP